VPVAFGNADPAVGDPVQIDQVVDLDLARRSKTGDHFLDQGRVVLGLRISRHRGQPFHGIADSVSRQGGHRFTLIADSVSA